MAHLSFQAQNLVWILILESYLLDKHCASAHLGQWRDTHFLSKLLFKSAVKCDSNTHHLWWTCLHFWIRERKMCTRFGSSFDQGKEKKVVKICVKVRKLKMFYFWHFCLLLYDSLELTGSVLRRRESGQDLESSSSWELNLGLFYCNGSVYVSTLPIGYQH